MSCAPLATNDPDPTEQILWDQLFSATAHSGGENNNAERAKQKKEENDPRWNTSGSWGPADSILIESHANEALTKRT
jgi:hypothetical protein